MYYKYSFLLLIIPTCLIFSFVFFFYQILLIFFSLRRVSYVFVLHLIVFKMSIAQGVFGGLQEVISFSLFFVLKKIGVNEF